MPMYYVNNNATDGVNHEVHTKSCDRLDEVKSKSYVGTFSNCADAVKEAKANHYAKSDGCYYCSKACHMG